MLRQVAASVLFGLALAAGGTASADGMPGSIKDAPVVAPTWSGFYIGAGIGYGLLAAENKYWEPQPTVFSSTWKGEGGQGGLGTVVIGFDRQLHDRYVLGAFVEYDWSSLELTYEDTNTPQQKFRMRDAFSVGGRAGFLMTPTSLLYVTGGYTWARGKSDQYFDIVNGTQTFYGVTSLDLNGPFVGIGMETQLAPRLALRAEGRYTMFNEVTTNHFNTAPYIFTDTMTADVLTARLVLTYKFTRDESHAQILK
jgi:outer membrane immunogenic protein